MTLKNTIRTIDSRNVVGRLEGSDPRLKDEYVIFTSHWDHYGIGPEIDGDKIYNGALDNATGVGGLIELARAFAALPTAPKRSLLFLSVTAEEQGLLGSEYYATTPLYPLAEDGGRHQHGRAERLRRDERPHGRRPRAVGPGRLRARGGGRAAAHGQGGPGARARRLLPVGSFPLREAGRARAQRRAAATSSSASRRTTGARCATPTPRSTTTSRATRSGPTGTSPARSTT